MKWIWPLSWYLRIRKLEATCAALHAKNLELDGMIRAQAIAQSAMTAAYMASCASIAGMARRP